MINRILTKVEKYGEISFKRYLSNSLPIVNPASFKTPLYCFLCDNFNNYPEDAKNLINSMTIVDNFLNDTEENSLLEEIEPYMKRLHYEFDHWDDAIHGYRETERLNWNENNTKIIDRVRSLAFPANVSTLKYVHILDLHQNGWIKPHIDAVRFCGDTIAGLSLLTDSIMRLVHDKKTEIYADFLLKRKSLYIMKGNARYDYKHEILKNEESIFKNNKINKGRRISVICRNEPDPKDKDD